VPNDPVATTGFDPEPAELAPALAPVRPERYLIGPELARGGMGIVYRATDTVLNRAVAVKVLQNRFDPNSAVARRFATEAQITAQLQHPGIPPVHDRGALADGSPFLAMKLINGHTLDALLDQRPDPADGRGRFVAAFEQIAQAVAFAHTQRIIHRDLKPANVMVGDFGEVQVMDWGLAKQLDTAEPAEPGAPAARVRAPADANRTTVHQPTDESTDPRTVAGQVMGTPAYMSPEQARGDTARVGCRSDVFALGGVLCAILTGKPPFTGGGEQTIRRAAAGDLSGAFARLDGCGADPELIALAKRCLAPDPDDRPADGADVAELVAAYRAGVEQRLRAAELSRASTEAKALEQRKRRRAQTALVGTVALLLAGLGAFGWWADRQSRARAAERDRTETETRAAQERADGEKRAADLRQQLDDERRAADERSRLARNGDAIAALAGRCEQHLRRGETEAAGVALAEAERRAKEGGGEPVAARLARCRADFVLLAKLDAVDRFAWSPINGNLPANFQIVALWRDTFGNAEMFGHQVAPKDAAARVRQSLVADKVLTALDSWLALEQSNWLRDMLHEADPDAYRDGVRAALRAGDKARVVDLIAQPQVEQQPARFAAAVGYMDAIPVTRRLKVLEVALRARPDALALLMLLGNLHDRAGSAGARLRWYQAAVAAHPRNAAARVGLADALANTGDTDGALAAYREATRLDPALVAAFNNLGNVLAGKSDHDGAATAYAEAIRLDPELAAAHFNLGLVRGKQGQRDKAIACYREALRIDPALAQAHLSLADALSARNDKAEAITSYRAALKLDPNLTGARVNLGTVLSDTGDRDGAIEQYRAAIRTDPKLAPAHYNLGLGLKAKADWAGASAAFRDAARLDPALPDVHNNLGIALARNKEFVAAVAAFREAVRRDPKNAGVHFNLGVALVDVGDLDGALVAIKEASRLEPKNAVFASAIGKVEGAIKKRGPMPEPPPPKQ